VLIDGTPFRDRQMIVALGINSDGRKTDLTDLLYQVEC